MRRWFWPYAILAVVLTLAGGVGAGTMLLGGGVERLGGQVAVANATVIEPALRFLISTLEMIAPFDLPGWFKNLYAVLVVIAIVGLFLSMALGLLLFPVFYALYRGSR